MKFELYEKYLEAQQDRAERFDEIAKKRYEAEEELRRLKLEYEHTMVQSLKIGGNPTTTLDKLDEQIVKAKRNVERAEQEYAVYGRIASVPITSEDIIATWNREFNPNYFDNEIKPALDELEQTKKSYYEAMCSYWKKVKQIKRFREDVATQLGFDYPHRFHIKDIETNSEYEHYFITQKDTENAQNGGN
ncbi:hypothetical protein V7148_11400 [Gottfriedia acidiceleris]|uniref:hypothetical protein n=1 Tax=Gottfriedia acidiceleris TaxID=371036 RepID=UPI002FFE4785